LAYPQNLGALHHAIQQRACCCMDRGVPCCDLPDSPCCPCVHGHIPLDHVADQVAPRYSPPDSASTALVLALFQRCAYVYGLRRLVVGNSPEDSAPPATLVTTAGCSRDAEQTSRSLFFPVDSLLPTCSRGMEPPPAAPGRDCRKCRSPRPAPSPRSRGEGNSHELKVASSPWRGAAAAPQRSARCCLEHSPRPREPFSAAGSLL
jgi:hypothetical protein